MSIQFRGSLRWVRATLLRRDLLIATMIAWTGNALPVGADETCDVCAKQDFKINLPCPPCLGDGLFDHLQRWAAHVRPTSNDCGCETSAVADLLACDAPVCLDGSCKVSGSLSDPHGQPMESALPQPPTPESPVEVPSFDKAPIRSRTTPGNPFIDEARRSSPFLKSGGSPSIQKQQVVVSQIPSRSRLIAQAASANAKSTRKSHSKTFEGSHNSQPVVTASAIQIVGESDPVIGR